MENRSYAYYLIFVLIACFGASIWQLFFPVAAASYSFWGFSSGWQREIGLWNIALIFSIICALIKKEHQSLKILSVQSTILFVILGINHAVTFFKKLPTFYIIHFLGVIEILLLGGLWGIIILVKGYYKKNNVFK